MKRTLASATLAFLALTSLSALAADAPAPAAPVPGLPLWAYPVPPPAPGRGQGRGTPAAAAPGATTPAANPATPAATPGSAPTAAATPATKAAGPAASTKKAASTEPIRVPNSNITMTRAQLRARGPEVPDWHPDDHPAMPDIVKKGREPQVWACGYCHLPNGAGRPENSSVAGLPAAYIKQQVLAFKHGQRNGSEPRRGSQNNMLLVAKEVSEEEIEIAAKYFAALKPEKFLTVVETDTVPKTIIAGGILAKAPGGGTEPIGNRIIEVPDSLERFEDRDSRIPYEVYVPPGSIKRGADLASTGNAGKTLQCFLCHGQGLKGMGDVPRLAGRSPSYLMRQLFDVKHGTRSGPSTDAMKIVVQNLTTDDMLDLSAYMASLPP